MDFHGLFCNVYDVSEEGLSFSIPCLSLRGGNGVVTG